MLSVKDYGALGDYNPTTQIGTDDRAAFAIAVAAAIAVGKALRIPPGKDHLSKYVLVTALADSTSRRARSPRSTMVSTTWRTYPTRLPGPTGSRDPGFYLRHCQDVTFKNMGVRRGLNTRVEPRERWGLAFLQPGVLVLGLSTAANATAPACLHRTRRRTVATRRAARSRSAPGIVTLTNADDPNGAFHAGMIGRLVTVAGATNPVNDGRFTILSVLSATQLTYANAAGIAEGTSPLVWSVDDGDNDTKIVRCRIR